MLVSYVVMGLFYVLFPALVIALCVKFPAVNKVGAVILCYVGGILFGNLGLVPAQAAGFQDLLTQALIALGISMLLFTLDVREWRATAGKALLSFALAAMAILVVAYVGVKLFGPALPDGAKLGGMAVGVYTGGTPNLASVKTALGVSNDTFVLMHTYDTVWSLLYILFCASVAQRLFGSFLKPFRSPATIGGDGVDVESVTGYRGIMAPRVLVGLGINLLVALVVSAVGLAVSLLVPAEYSTPVAILSITTLAIVVSFIRPVRSAAKGFQAGMYLIYVFCTVVASMVRISDIVTIHWPMLWFVAVCIFGSMAVHSLLCWVFRIDVDTFLITSVSAICSPPFVPVVSSALRNHHVLLAGITTGIIGYAIGNYLGITAAFLYR